MQIDQQLSTLFELKFLAEAGIFEGYASVFGITDAVDDRIDKGAFETSLKQWQQAGRMPPLLWQHDMAQPIGAWDEMREDGHGLWVKGRLFVQDIAKAREAYRLLREGVVTGLSIGYRTRQAYQDAKTGARVLTQIDLLEVSMVTIPANDLARVSQVKSILGRGALPSSREFEAFLREAGFSRKQAKGLTAFGYKALQPRDAEESDDVLVQGLRQLSTLLQSI